MMSTRLQARDTAAATGDQQPDVSSGVGDGCGFCGDVPVRLLVWDTPNIDMAIGAIVGRRPTSGERPDMQALIGWMASRGVPGELVEACVFVNVAAGNGNGLQGWVTYLLETGVRVFAKPKHNGDGDIDPDMLAHIDRHTVDGGGRLVEVIVASHDAANFADRLAELVAAGATVSVLVFPERAGCLPEIPGVEVIDLEDVPGLIEVALPRISLHSLPGEGCWLDPPRRIHGGGRSAGDVTSPPGRS